MKQARKEGWISEIITNPRSFDNLIFETQNADLKADPEIQKARIQGWLNKIEMADNKEQAAKYLADAAEKTGAELKEPLWPDIKIPSGKAQKNWPDDNFKRAKEIISFANDIIPQKQMLILHLNIRQYINSFKH
jgi:hypothetical protein